MAETVVSSLIDRLVPLLAQEAILLRGIHGEVVDIKDELESIQSFLKDADARAAAEDTSEGVKIWVKQVREVALRIDVAIDRYLLHVAQHGPHRPGFTGFVHKTTHSLKTLKPRHKIASEIQEIKHQCRKSRQEVKSIASNQLVKDQAVVHRTLGGTTLERIPFILRMQML